MIEADESLISFPLSTVFWVWVVCDLDLARVVHLRVHGVQAGALDRAHHISHTLRYGRVRVFFFSFSSFLSPHQLFN